MNSKSFAGLVLIVALLGISYVRETEETVVQIITLIPALVALVPVMVVLIPLTLANPLIIPIVIGKCCNGRWCGFNPILYKRGANPS